MGILISVCISVVHVVLLSLFKLLLTHKSKILKFIGVLITLAAFLVNYYMILVNTMLNLADNISTDTWALNYAINFLMDCVV